MIIGMKQLFAMEYGIHTVSPIKSLRALGLFNLHIGGSTFGSRAKDASWLACSIDEVQSRIRDRGRHVAVWASYASASEIASAYWCTFFEDKEWPTAHCIKDRAHFEIEVDQSKCEWIPDGDAAFDDGSHVLQWDIGDSVRLVAFKARRVGKGVEPESIVDVTLDGTVFYRVLQEWHGAITAEIDARLIGESETGTG